MNPYYHFVSEVARITREGKSYPLGQIPRAARPVVPPDAPRVLIFAPHPDDESIIGGLPLRLLREAKMNVIAVAVTQGSNKQRQGPRFEEMKAACTYLGFHLLQTRPGGLERVKFETRERDPAHWRGCVETIAQILADQRPHVVFCPHDDDLNATHIGVHFLVTDALRTLPDNFECHVIETEFWRAMRTPNLMVELSESDVADLVAATSFHIDEVKRNPYHVLLPAWLQDNVRRGAEIVFSQGDKAPDFMFSSLYRVSRWSRGKLTEPDWEPRQLSLMDDPTSLFA